MGDQLTLFLTAVGTGMVLIAAGWLLLRLARGAAAGTLRRSELSGIRTRATLSLATPSGRRECPERHSHPMQSKTAA